VGRVHRTAEHQRARAAMAPAVAAGEAYCTQPRCLMRSRWIRPGSPWDAAHNRRTGGYYGPAHRKCNRSEGATFGNRLRGARRRSVLTSQPAPTEGLSWSSRKW